MVLDLDGFKGEHDRSGHTAGDALLLQVRQRCSRGRTHRPKRAHPARKPAAGSALRLTASQRNSSRSTLGLFVWSRRVRDEVAACCLSLAKGGDFLLQFEAPRALCGHP
jgi:hypothetical protein